MDTVESKEQSIINARTVPFGKLTLLESESGSIYIRYYEVPGNGGNTPSEIYDEGGNPVQGEYKLKEYITPLESSIKLSVDDTLTDDLGNVYYFQVY